MTNCIGVFGIILCALLMTKSIMRNMLRDFEQEARERQIQRWLKMR